MDRVRLATFTVIALVTPLMPVPVQAVALASAAAQASAPLEATPSPSDIRKLERTRFTLDGRPLPEARGYPPSAGGRRATAGTPAVGTVREWLGLDDRTGKYYRKNYTLRAVGRHIEVWTADDLAFPADDCRKNATEITGGQIADLVREFDTTIYPKESAAFSTPPDRTGA